MELPDEILARTECSRRREETLDDTIVQRVKDTYFDRMRQNSRFCVFPYLDKSIFRSVYARVTHNLGIYYHRGKSNLSCEEEAERRWYSQYYRLALRQLDEAIRRLDRNTRKEQTRRATAPPTPRQLRLLFPSEEQPHPSCSPPPEIKAKLTELRKRLGDSTGAIATT